MLKEPLHYYTFNPHSISHRKETPERIQDYQTGIRYILDIYKNSSVQEQKFILHRFIPSILRQQYLRCLDADESSREEIWKVFAAGLRDLQQRKLLSWRGHNIFRYLKYLRLLRKNTETF